MNNVILPTEFDADKLTINSNLNTKSLMKSVYVSYKNSSFIVQLPPRVSPYSLSQYKDPKTGKPLNENKMTFNLLLDNPDNRPSVEATKEFFEKIEKKAIEAGAKNSQKWFSKNLSEDIIANLFFKSNLKYPMIKNDKGEKTGEIDKTAPPTIALSLYKNENGISGNATDMNDRPIDLAVENIKGALITPIIRISSLWIGNGMFGYSFKVLKMRVILKNKMMNEISFRNDIERIGTSQDDDEDEEDENESKGKRSKIPQNPTSAQLEESEEENYM